VEPGACARTVLVVVPRAPQPRQRHRVGRGCCRLRRAARTPGRRPRSRAGRRGLSPRITATAAPPPWAAPCEIRTRFADDSSDPGRASHRRASTTGSRS